MAKNWRAWVVDRFGLAQIGQAAVFRRVARGSWYYGDGATLALLFGVLIVTGAVMTLTYSPTPDTAYESVRYITETQTLGWFVRGLHYWSAGLMVVMIFFHLFRLVLVAGYKFPREGTWLIGVVMLYGVLLMSYSGYLLRWDERAVYAIQVALHVLYRIPWIGEQVVIFVQGGQDIGAQTLTRFFSLHVIFLPALLIALVSYHLYLVMLHGITCPSERRQPIHSDEEQRRVYKEDAHSERNGEDFYPVTMLKSGAMGGVVFALVVALTLFLGPRELQPEANLVQPAMPAEEWWFWWYSGLIALLPPAIAPAFELLFPIVVFLLLVALPFIDRSPKRGIRQRPAYAALVVLLVIALVALSDYRRSSPFTAWPEADLPPLPPEVEPTVRVEQGRVLFARYGCNSCHAIAGHGRRVGPDLTALPGKRSLTEIREFVQQPPEGVAMPAYQGHMPEEELELVVEFVHRVQSLPREQ